MELIQEIDNFLETEYQNTINCIEKIRTQFPDRVYHQTILEILQERQIENDKHIQKKRERYSKIDNFVDRQVYYNEVLKISELGYQKSQKSIQNYIKNPKPKPYEYWVTPLVYDFMKINGYRNTIRLYITLNQIIE